MEPENMTWVVAGKQYRTNKATLVAHDEYWNGYSCEQGGRKHSYSELQRVISMPSIRRLLPGEINRVVPLESNEAMSLYQSLHVKEVPFKVVFPDVKIEEA